MNTNTITIVLEKCKSSHADMLLLAGDLFHENKPSRRTMHRTIDLLRKYCLGVCTANTTTTTYYNNHTYY